MKPGTVYGDAFVDAVRCYAELIGDSIYSDFEDIGVESRQVADWLSDRNLPDQPIRWTVWDRIYYFLRGFRRAYAMFSPSPKSIANGNDIMDHIQIAQHTNTLTNGGRANVAHILGVDKLCRVDIPFEPVSGVYFLCLDDIIVYAGKAKDVGGRIRQWCKQRRIKFNSVYFVPTPKERLMKVESSVIELFKPGENICAGWTMITSGESEVVFNGLLKKSMKSKEEIELCELIVNRSAENRQHSSGMGLPAAAVEKKITPS